MTHSVFKGPIELPSPLQEEGEAQEAMQPGYLVEPDFTVGDSATAGLLLILKEGGPGKGEGIDYDYEVGDQVAAYNARQGLRFSVRVATGQALTKNVTLLERDDLGQLVVLSAGTAVAVAKETVTTTADGELVEVEVL